MEGNHMRISTRGRYALRALVDLALSEGEGLVQQEAIARRQEIPSPYLARLMAQLAGAGILSGARGPGGGYRLARPAAEITAGDVVRAVEGPIEVVKCTDPTSKKVCPRQTVCVTQPLWKRVGQAVAEVLDGVTLQDLVEQAREIGERKPGV
jgi:Rrf2 family protein